MTKVKAGRDLLITQRKVRSLSGNSRNARTHPESQISQITESIRVFGFNNPILTRGDQVVAGHGRLIAAQRLGMESVPTIDLSHLNETQARAYIIADNQIALNSGWDEGILADELEALSLVGIGKGILGFEDEPEELRVPVEIRPLDISELVHARFWLNVEGPLQKQMVALEVIKKTLKDIQGVTVNAGVTTHED